MPPRRTRAMGFSPGGAKALDINAPSRKRKNQPQQEVMEPAEVEANQSRSPIKQSRAKTVTPEPSTDDSKPSRARPKTVTTNTQTRRTRRTETQALESNIEPNIPDTIKSSPAKRQPTKRTRGRAATKSSDDSQSAETQRSEEIASLTSAKVPSNKRNRVQYNTENLSINESESQQLSTSPEAETRPAKRPRIHGYTRPSRISSTPKIERQSNITQSFETTVHEESNSGQQPSPPTSESSVIADAAADNSSDEEQDMSDTPTDTNQDNPDAPRFPSEAASDTSEIVSEVEHGAGDYDDDHTEDSADSLSEDVEYTSRLLTGNDYPSAGLASYSSTADSNTPQAQRSGNDFQNHTQSSTQAISKRSYECQLLTAEDISEIDPAKDRSSAVRDRSSAWKFAQSTYQRKLAVDDEMEDEDWERLAAQQSIKKRPLERPLKENYKAREASPFEGAQKTRGDKVITARYFEWVDDSDAMFVAKRKDYSTPANGSPGSNREDTLSSLPRLLTYHPPTLLRATPLTDPRIIDAVSTSMQYCIDNPESIPTRAELSLLLEGATQSRQSQPDVPATPPSRVKSLFGFNQNTSTRSPMTPLSQTSTHNLIRSSDASPARKMSSGDTNGLAEHQDLFQNDMQSESGNMSSDSATGPAWSQEQAQNSVQPEAARGGWAAALSASRIGTILQSPLRLFSRASRVPQNAPATDVRRVAAQSTHVNITQSERPKRTADPILPGNRRTGPSSVSRSSGAHRTSRTSSTDVPKTPTPASRQTPRGRRRDAHLPVEWRGVRYQDLPPELQAISQHMNPSQHKSSQESPAPQSKSTTLSAEEQKFLDDNREAILKQREINLKRILSGRKGMDAFRDEEDITQTTQDLSQDLPGSKRKRVTFALEEDMSKKTYSNTFSVPDDSDEDSLIASESPPSSRRHHKKRTPRPSVPSNFSPIDKDDSSPPAKKARVEHRETSTMGPHLWLNMTMKDVYGASFGDPVVPPNNWKQHSEESEPPLLQRPSPQEDNVFMESPKALNEISVNRNVQQKPIIHDSFQKSQKHMPKNPSTLRQVTTVSPATSPGVSLSGRGSVATSTPPPVTSNAETKSDYGPFVTDPVVIAYVDSMPEEQIQMEKFPLPIYKELTGEDHPSLYE